MTEQTDQPIPIEPAPSVDGEAAAPAYDLLQRALADRATDIHIDPSTRGDFAIRFRVDGRLRQYCRMDADLARALIKRYKVLSDLDIAEPFQAQEGLLALPEQFEDTQVRITCAPVAGGECVCLRIHTHDIVARSLAELGFSTDARRAIHNVTERPEGLVLVAGPTGSGKTTTIYSILREQAEQEGHPLIASIEDPVEINVPFMRQMRVDDEHGITIASGLRTMLRMDPDILFVGEVRDEPTADIVMQAASSGRQVFATLHSRSVAAAVTAFDDLSIDRRSLSANLRGIVSQRLLRTLCTECRHPGPLPDNTSNLFEERSLAPPARVYEARGCQNCSEGFAGRTGIFQVGVVDRALRAAIARGAPETEIDTIIENAGSQSLATLALKKVIAGDTSLHEALRLRVFDAPTTAHAPD